jgi:gliding motility-associated-like protein
MKKQVVLLLVSVLAFVATGARAQLLYNNEVVINITQGVTVYIGGSVKNENGQINVDNTSTASELIIQDDFQNYFGAIAGGDGYFRVNGDWINDGTFIAGTGTVFLEGATQLISGNVSTTFNNLTIDGTDVKVQTIDQYCTGILSLNEIELKTETFGFFVENTDVNAILRTDGFISSLNGGFLSRQTNSIDIYIFPVGSSVGVSRYRPVEITPTTLTANTYTVRMANIDATTEGFDRSLMATDVCQINPLFYHQINRTNGTSAINLDIYYENIADGDWEGISNWTTSPDLWDIIVGSSTASVVPFYKASVTAWNEFSEIPYALYAPTPVAQINSNTSICESNDIVLQEIGGDAVLWNWEGPNGFTSTDHNPTISAVDPAANGLYSVTITNTYGCTASDSETVTVDAAVYATITPVGPFCESESAVTLTAADAGGTWTGDGVIGNSFDPATAGDGIHNITYNIINGACSDSDDIDITVNANPTSPTTSIDCTGGENAGIITVTAPLGVNYEYTIDGSYQSTLDFGPLTNGSYTVIVQDITTGCTTSGTLLNLDCGCVNPPTLALSAASASTCGTDAATISGNAFGGSTSEVTITHDGNGTLDETTISSSPFSFTYNPDASDIGDIVTITITTDNPSGSSCNATQEIFILTIYDSPQVSASSNSPVCEGNDINFTETAGDAINWQWEGPNSFTSTDNSPIITNSTTSAIGSYAVTITDSNGCTASDNLTVLVIVAPDPTISEPGVICSETEPFDLYATNAGGVWSGIGVDSSTGEFDPEIAGVGNHEIIYTISGPCGNADTIYLTITQQADATIVSALDTLFITDPAVYLEVTDNGGLWEGNGTDEITGEFTPSIADLGNHEIIYTISGDCGDADSIIIVIISQSILDLLIADVLTPNNDGYNDTWIIQGIEAFENVNIVIFDRWGDEVFEFTGTGYAYFELANQFDGIRNGKELPFGTYVYLIELDYGTVYKGILTIIR